MSEAMKMGPRFVFTAFIVALGIAVIFATVTTIRQVQMHTSSVVQPIAGS
jgi:hypothetical protein